MTLHSCFQLASLIPTPPSYTWIKKSSKQNLPSPSIQWLPTPPLLQHTTEDQSGARPAKSWISKPAKQEVSSMTMHSRAAESNKQNWQIVTVQHTQNHFRQQQRFHFPNVVLLAWPSLQRETISEQRWLNCNQTMTGLPHLSQETQVFLQRTVWTGS